jgi:putative transposase
VGKIGRRADRWQSHWEQPRLPLRERVREALFDTVIVCGLEYVGEALEEERVVLCGPRYQHDPQRQASRAGLVTGSLSLGGRRVEVERPRARSVGGHELSLPSWRAWSARDPLEQRAMEQMLVGVSTRRYARSLEPLPSELRVRGIGKSVVSERFVVGTARRLAALMGSKSWAGFR